MNVSRILFLLVGLTCAGAAQAGTLYAVDSTTDSLYAVDKTTGAATLLGSTGQEITQGGLVFDSSTGRLIASNLFVQGSIDARGIGSTTPGNATLSAPNDYALSLFVPSLAYHAPSDTLYGLSTNPYQLQTIDRATGAASFGPVPGADPPTVVDLIAIAFSPNGATLYGVSQFGFHLVDRTTAHITPIGPHGLDLNPNLGAGLTFDPDDGILYLSNATNGDLYRIDPATGVATRIGATGISRPSGIAAVRGATVEVPTLGQVGLIALAILIGAMGALLLRRRFALVRG